jgi:hypothetical protein
MFKANCQLAVMGLLFWAPTSSAWSLFGPKTVEECILENMKGVTSDAAAKSIEEACFEKYYQPTKKKQCKLRELNKNEVDSVKGTGGVRDIGSPYFSVRLYNGSGVQIEQIKVYIFADNIKPGQEYDLTVLEPIKPKSSTDVGASIQVFPTKNFSWGIYQMKTCDKQAL